MITDVLLVRYPYLHACSVDLPLVAQELSALVVWARPPIMQFDICGVIMETHYHLEIRVFAVS